jgi:POT family proton-dependent oligopeptide transporter
VSTAVAESTEIPESQRPVPVTSFERSVGHPPGLFILFFTEMWERFSYYGMRGLLKLYMANYLFVTLRQVYQGKPDKLPGNPELVHGIHAVASFLHLPGAPSEQASIIYGWYTGLVYFTPLFGGMIADRLLGQRKTVVVGGILMAIGHFVMAFENWFYIALLLLILGNGAFKPNISTQVGNLYAPDDPRRDRAFSIFYVGINLGAFLCNFVCGTLAAVKGWHWGFGAAGVGMCLGLILYLVAGHKYLAPDNMMKKKAAAAAAGEGYRDTAAAKEEKPAPFTPQEWSRIGALVALCALNVVFWAVYEQQGNTMQTWADEQTRWPVIFGFQIPATWFQSVNPFFIFTLTPLFTMLWTRQAEKGKEPSSVTKMAIGCLVLGLSFIVMIIGARVVGDGRGSWFWPVFCTLLLTIGELYLSPIGLSLVTKVSPARIVSMMMGMWFLSSFFGNILSGYIGVLYTRWSKDSFFALLLALGVGTSLAIFAFNRPLKRAIGHQA